MKNYRIKPWLPGLEKSRKTWKRNDKWSNLDGYRCCTSILVIALEINYQFGRKFTNHNNGRSIIIGRRAISRVFHLWIKSREIESSSQCSICFNIEPERNTRLVFLIIVNDLEGSDLRGPSVRKSGYPLLWLGGEGGGERSVPQPPSLRPREQYQSNSRRMHDAHILRYIIFIIRARDTRSRAVGI